MSCISSGIVNVHKLYISEYVRVCHKPTYVIDMYCPLTVVSQLCNCFNTRFWKSLQWVAQQWYQHLRSCRNHNTDKRSMFVKTESVCSECMQHRKHVDFFDAWGICFLLRCLFSYPVLNLSCHHRFGRSRTLLENDSAGAVRFLGVIKVIAALLYIGVPVDCTMSSKIYFSKRKKKS